MLSSIGARAIQGSRLSKMLFAGVSKHYLNFLFLFQFALRVLAK
jgi:hypothetical protein